MNEYNIVEAASILKEKGVIKSAEINNSYIIDNNPTTHDISQVMLWIREYDKAYKKAYHVAVTSGNNYEEAVQYAEKKASYEGIKATYDKEQQSHIIKSEDLHKFIELKTVETKEKRILEELSKFKTSKQNEIQKIKGRTESHYFAMGFEAAIASLEKMLFEDTEEKVDSNSKNIISFPKNESYLNKENIYALDFQLWNTSDSDILLVDFANKEIEQLKFKMSVYKPKNGNEAETNIEWVVEDGILSIHNQRDIEDFMLDKRNICKIKRILQHQVPEYNENKNEILNMFIS